MLKSTWSMAGSVASSPRTLALTEDCLIASDTSERSSNVAFIIFSMVAVSEGQGARVSS